MLDLIQTSTFKKNFKKYKHNKVVLQEFNMVVELLLNEQPIPIKYRNHKLSGDYAGVMELHLRPDDLLVYFIIENQSVTLVAIGSHADLFG